MATTSEKTGARWPQQAVLAAEEKTMGEKVAVQFWRTCVRRMFDLINSTDKSVFFLCLGNHGQGRRMALHEEGRQTGTIFTACTWIYTKAVTCNGQRHMETFSIIRRNSIMEAASWVGAYCQDNHDRISQFSLIL